MIARTLTLRPRVPDTLVVFVVALIVRALFAWAVPPGPVTADASDYDRLAHAILAGDGYVGASGLPTSERPPLYSYFLAGIYSVSAAGPALARAAQSVLDAVTCVLVYLIALRHFGIAAARAAAAFAIVSLSLLFATRYLLTETMAVFFMVALVLALDVAIARWHRAAFFATGVLIGLATLTKGTTLALPAALIAPIAVAGRRQPKRVLLATGLMLAGVVAALLPWTIRNYRVHGEFVPVATQLGHVIYSSYRPPQGKIFGLYTMDETVFAADRQPEVERSRTLTRAAFQHVREHADELPRLELLKLLFFVSPFDWELLGAAGVFNFTYALMVPFAMYGAWRARPLGWRSLLLATPVLYLLALSLALYGSPRIRLPVEPLLMVFAGWGVVAAWQRSRRPQVFLAGVIAAAIAGCVLYVFSGEIKRLSAEMLRSAGVW